MIFASFKHNASNGLALGNEARGVARNQRKGTKAGIERIALGRPASVVSVAVRRTCLGVVFIAAAVFPLTAANAQLGIGGLLDDVVDVIDVCANVAGVQVDLGDCPSSGGADNDVAVDLCVDLPGIQIDAGDCASSSSGDLNIGVDVCADLPGIQLDIGDCGGGGGGDVGVDVCANLPGIQLDIGDCAGGDGGGVAVDVCANLPGIQLDIGDCVGGGGGGGGVDVCSNLPGVQLNIGECAGGDGGGPTGPIDGGLARANAGGPMLGAIGGANGPQVCLFTAPNYEGTRFCVGRGGMAPDLGAFDNAVRSIWVDPGATAQVCSQAGMSGVCTMVTGSLPQLYGGWDLEISSVLVQ